MVVLFGEIGVGFELFYLQFYFFFRKLFTVHRHTQAKLIIQGPIIIHKIFFQQRLDHFNDDYSKPYSGFIF